MKAKFKTFMVLPDCYIQSIQTAGFAVIDLKLYLALFRKYWKYSYCCFITVIFVLEHRQKVILLQEIVNLVLINSSRKEQCYI